MDFEGQHIIITGGSSGIGQATAQQLAQSGAHITIIARNLAQLEVAKSAISTAKARSDQKILTLAADVSDQPQVAATIEAAIAQNGPPDGLITSAGMAHPGYFQDLPLEIFERTMAVNYFGTLYSIKAALPAMVQRGCGHLVLISSGVGLMGIFGYTPYSPSKFALRGLAESLRGELRPCGIHLSIVYPPDTDTPQLQQENQTKPPETKAIAATAEMWTAEDVATEIVRGMKTKAFVITPGLEMTLLARFHSLLSPVLNWYFDRIVTRGLKA